MSAKAIQEEDITTNLVLHCNVTFHSLNVDSSRVTHTCLDDPRRLISTLLDIPIFQRTTQQTTLPNSQTIMTTIELMLSNSTLSRHEVVQPQIGKVVVLGNGVVGTVVHVFEERIGDEGRTMRVGLPGTVEADSRPVDTSLVLLTTSSLRGRGERLEKRRTLSWHDDDDG